MPTLTGTVCDGYGSAARDVTAGVYNQIGQLWPGTLNLTVDRLPDLPAPWVRIDYAGIVRRIWPATVNDVPVWLLHADHLGLTVELLSTVHLRTELDLSNGDQIEVTL